MILPQGRKVFATWWKKLFPWKKRPGKNTFYWQKLKKMLYLHKK
jgi:hypothetical protein